MAERHLDDTVRKPQKDIERVQVWKTVKVSHRVCSRAANVTPRPSKKSIDVVSLNPRKCLVRYQKGMRIGDGGKWRTPWS